MYHQVVTQVNEEMKSIFGGSNIVLVHEIHNQVDRFGVCSKAYMISTVKP